MMTGWKTWTGAIGAFAGGIVMMASGLTAETLNPDQVWQGIIVCAGAFAAVGIGSKIEKNNP